jgi:hypothetical protein
MQEGQEGAGDKPLPEARQVAVHKTHLLSHCAAPKVELLHKIENQTANHHNMLTERGQLTEH